MSEQRYLIVDVGSTTTKALLIEPVMGEYRLTYRGEAATTVERPYADVMIGVRRAVSELAESSGYNLLTSTGINLEMMNGGCSDFLATSSAGGGLQVLVCGLVKKVTAESAERAALGAGAIIVDVISADDGRSTFRRLEAVRQARPDMILLAGGVDSGGSVEFAIEFADLLNYAKPQSRLGSEFRLPVIYAGNNAGAPLVQDTLDSSFELHIVPNLRPGFHEENLQPARDMIHEVFLGHVMEQAPGYPGLKRLTTAPVLPTPVAVGRIMTHLAERDRVNILGVDIGGATTDVFSVVDGQFARTVSANLGMSYSAGNVLLQAGPAAIKRWLPFQIRDEQLQDVIANKVVFPTTVPDDWRELLIEQALAREAMRLALEQHAALTVKLPVEKTTLQKAFSGALSNIVQSALNFDLSKINLLVGSGGVLSHAPLRSQAAAMLLDAFQPLGYTELAVDSIFMMPHLGALTQKNPDAALNVLEQDCFIRLGPNFSLFSLSPELERLGENVVEYELTSQGTTQRGTVCLGSLQVLPLSATQGGRLRLRPLSGDIGAGKGVTLDAEIRGGAVGVIVDCRGRGINWPKDSPTYPESRRWLESLGAVDPDALGGGEGD